MKLGIIKKDKSKVEIESHSIHLVDFESDNIAILYITKDFTNPKKLTIKKEDIQLIYFGDWK